VGKDSTIDSEEEEKGQWIKQNVYMESEVLQSKFFHAISMISNRLKIIPSLVARNQPLQKD